MHIQGAGEMLTLDELAIQHGTDKSTQYHGYSLIYDAIFSCMRSEPVSLLEIGVYGGASLRMWRDYFPRGQITGIDIMHECGQHRGDRIRVEIADQRTYTTDETHDIIIDDGSHDPDHFLESFRRLWPSVRPGGYYCIEDLSVCGHPRYPERYGRAMKSFLAGEVYEHLTGRATMARSVTLYPKMLVAIK